MTDVYRFQYEWTLKGQQMVTGLDYQTDNFFATSEPAASEVLDAIDDHLQNRFLHCLSTLGVLDTCSVRQRVVDASVPKTSQRVISATGLAALGPQEVPLELCGVIARKSDAAIRSGHGWMFMPPILDAAGFNSEGQLALGHEYEANLSLFAALLDDDLNTGFFVDHALHPVIYSAKRHRTSVSPYTFQVTQAVVRRKAHFLRSREAQAV